MNKIELNNNDLDNIEMELLSKQLACYAEYFVLKSGQEHYRLLRYLAKKINSDIVEIGTHCGTSAVALSADTSHNVFTYDICDIKQKDFSHLSNVQFIIGDFMSDTNNKNNILNSKMIFIDAPHNGEFEFQCYNWLIENNYNGITVWDDIYLNKEMQNFWNSVEHKKLDITKYGHVTGTGLIYFTDKIEIVLK